MADENVTIGIKTDVDNSGAKSVINDFSSLGKETVAATKHATQLLRIIAELTHQLDGMDSDAAKVLRHELANLSDTINSLDIERLHHLDSILENIAKTGAKLGSAGLDGFEDKIASIGEEAKKFQESFSNANQVQVDVDVDGLDKLDALQKKIEGTAAADKLVDSLKAIRNEAQAMADESLAPMIAEIDRMIQQAQNAGPQSVENLRDSFADLAKQIDQLTDAQKKILKSFDFSKVSGQLDDLQDKVGTVASRAKNGGDAINATASILQGNLNGIGDLLRTLISRTGSWSRAMSAVGVGKAAAALGIFVAGMNSLVNLGKQWLGYWRDVTREMEKQNISSFRQTAGNLQSNLDYAEVASGRKMRRRDIAEGAKRAQEAGIFAARIADVNLRRQEMLAGNYNDISRERINREADREIEDIEIQKERQAIAYEESDRQAKLAEAKAKQERMLRSRIDFQKQKAGIINAANQTEEPGMIKEYFMNVLDSVGLTDFKGDNLDKIQTAADAEQAIDKIIQDIGEKIKDGEVDIEQLEKDKVKTDEAMAELSRRETAMTSSRQREDMAVEHGLGFSRYSRTREYDLQQRDEYEADRRVLRQWQNSFLGANGRTANAAAEVVYQQDSLAKAESKMQDLIRSVEARTGQPFNYDDMTDEEMAKFRDFYSDIRSRKESVRGSKGEYFDALREGAQKDVEFRNGLKDSNRLVALGLAGGGEVQWGKDTAKNTSKMVSLLEQLSNNVKGSSMAFGGDHSAQFGY